MTAASGGGWVELRVHGIGGTTAASMLGNTPDAALVPRWPLGEGAKPHVWRGDAPDVAAFHWADLTSGSRWFVLWPLLLPFTLLNVAGFMYSKGRLGSALRLLHGLLCLVATAWFSAWLVYGGQLVAGAKGWGETAGVWLAIVTAVLVVVPSAVRRRYPQGEVEQGPRPPGHLQNPRFFHDGRILWSLHALVVVATIAALWISPQDGPTSSVESGAADVVVDTGIILVALLWVLVVGSSMQRLAPKDRREPLAWTFRAVAATGLGAALIGGLMIALMRVMVGAERLRGAPFAVFDAYGWAVLAAVGAGLAGVVFVLVHASPGERAGACSATLLPHPVSWFRARVAMLPRAAVVGAGAAALAFLTIGTVLFVVRAPATTAEWLERLGVGDGSTPAQRVDEAAYRMPETALVRIAHWTIYGLFTVMFLNLVRSRGAASALRRIGSVWDVLTFWPRHFHPFAVRPYTEAAVDQLRELLFTEVLQREGASLTVVAHSQGTMLAVAALAPGRRPGRDGNDAATTSRVTHLVTAGSPLQSLYMKAFPAYVDDGVVRDAAVALAPGGRWTNVFRFTDYVGRTVFAEETEWVATERPPRGEPQDRWWSVTTLDGGVIGIDCALPDPDGNQGTIRGHNDYWTDRAVRKVVG